MASKPVDGLLLIDKPAGMTSHDVVDSVRRRFHTRRVGHGGTLDPAATGLLILLLGSATRQASRLLGADKSYLATVRLGVSTDTQDAEGRVLETRPVGPVSLEVLEQACTRFRGEIEQEIPAYSAVRIQGRRSYALARAGLPVPRRSRRVTIHRLQVLQLRLPDIDLEMICSKGTYVRTLCADLGRTLGFGGHLLKLRRTRIGPFTLEQAVPLAEVGDQHLVPAEILLAGSL